MKPYGGSKRQQAAPDGGRTIPSFIQGGYFLCVFSIYGNL
jgi:hypothetical protein